MKAPANQDPVPLRVALALLLFVSVEEVRAGVESLVVSSEMALTAKGQWK